MNPELNFSPEPFKHRSPRLLGLWLLNILLLAGLVGIVFHWQGLRAKNAAVHGELDDLENRRQAIITKHEKVISEMERIDMRGYRKEVGQFSAIQANVQTHWGQLLDDLGGLLPEDVRIASLRPRIGGNRRERRQTTLKLAGAARNKAAQLAFIEALQNHAAFDQVQFEQESYDETGAEVVFEIRFNYRRAGSR